VHNSRNGVTVINKYKNTHRWLILAFIIVLLGFLRGYWSNFAEAEFGHHLHMFSALIWFGFLAAQPWLATHGQIKRHRRNGMIGLFVAGLVVASAMLMLPGNIEGAQGAPDGGFVGATFLYGITFFDLITIAAFAVCIVMAIVRSKQLDDHAVWMIATVYCILGPALARMMVFPLVMVYGFENLTFIEVLYYSQPIMMAVIAFTAWRLKNYHSALILAFTVNAGGFLVEWTGNNAVWRSLCDSLFLGG
jgi:uncharacterized membrane protein